MDIFILFDFCVGNTPILKILYNVTSDTDDTHFILEYCIFGFNTPKVVEIEYKIVTIATP